MLHNNLDPAVAERPEDLVVYGGTGKAARDWPSFDAISRTLQELDDDETLLVQSGRPVGVLRTHEWAPRVLIANSNLVGEWDNWDEFRRLEQLGLTMYGQMTAGSWIYIGSQGILQGTYETFAAVAAKRFGGSLAGTLTLTAGFGRHGGSPAAGRHHERRGDHLRRRRSPPACSDGWTPATSTSSPLTSTRPSAWPASPRTTARPSRSAWRPTPSSCWRHSSTTTKPSTSSPTRPRLTIPLMYVPLGLTVAEAADLRRVDPDGYIKRARDTIARHVTAMLALLDRGAEVFDYGNSLRAEARLAGVRPGVRLPGFRPRLHSPALLRRQRARSGGSPCRAIRPTSAPPTGPSWRSSPTTSPSARWIRMASDRVAFQGLPARICWLGLGERARMGARFNDMVASGRLAAPIVIGRDHLDCGSVASPYRETEAMADGSDAIADWPLLNAMVNVASGASWVSIHDGGGSGIGRSLHAGQVSVADGTPLAAAKLERVLTNDPAMGVIRHVDAGYPTPARWPRPRDSTFPARHGIPMTVRLVATLGHPMLREWA